MLNVMFCHISVKVCRVTFLLSLQISYSLVTPWQRLIKSKNVDQHNAAAEKNSVVLGSGYCLN